MLNSCDVVISNYGASMTQTYFYAEADLKTAYRSDPEQFANTDAFRRVTCDLRGTRPLMLHPDSSGHMVLVPVGNGHCVVPNPYIRMDDVAYYDVGYQEMFECPEFRKGGSYSTVTLVKPAYVREMASGNFVLLSKGRLHLT